MLQRRRSSFLMAVVATTATTTLLLLGRASTTTASVLRPRRPSLLPAFLPPSPPTTTTSRGVRSRSGPGNGSSLANSIRLAWGKVLGSALAEEVDPGEVEGTDLRVLKYPDPRLRASNAEITVFGPEVAALAKDMFKVMYAMNGVGLAAPQVGVNQRLMVFNPLGDKVKWLNEVVLCNPVIVESSAKTEVAEEGCLSFPGMAGDVRMQREGGREAGEGREQRRHEERIQIRVLIFVSASFRTYCRWSARSLSR